MVAGRVVGPHVTEYAQQRSGAVLSAAHGRPLVLRALTFEPRPEALREERCAPAWGLLWTSGLVHARRVVSQGGSLSPDPKVTLILRSKVRALPCSPESFPESSHRAQPIRGTCARNAPASWASVIHGSRSITHPISGSIREGSRTCYAVRRERA